MANNNHWMLLPWKLDYENKLAGALREKLKKG
jgi:hypothetical protein